MSHLERVSQLDYYWKVSELRVVRVCHSKSKSIWEEAIARSGEANRRFEVEKVVIIKKIYEKLHYYSHI